jgi:hypothetical protein
VVAATDEPTLPFGDASFDLVVSRHPVPLAALGTTALWPLGNPVNQTLSPPAQLAWLTELML